MEHNKSEVKRLRGVYLVPDPKMLKPNFGPSEHIKKGFAQLQKYFDIELFVIGEYKDEQKRNSESNNTRSKTAGVATGNGFVGMLRDLKLLYKSNQNTRKILLELKRKNIDFIYERGQYLDFRGVRIAKQLHIKHFYEVNWLNFLGIKQFYKSWFNPVAKFLEERSYTTNELNFFVGTQHRYIKIPDSKVHTIQNGIEEQLIEDLKTHSPVVQNILKCCYVANLMPHHRFDILVEALRIAGINEKIELHLVGYNFEKHLPDLPGNIKVIAHGPLNKKELFLLLKEFNLGMVSGGPEYSSFMKLFEYAAFKMCVICPALENVTNMFEQNEICFFETDNPESLAASLQKLAGSPELMLDYGRNMYKKVAKKYTWEKIYQDIANAIKKTYEA